MMEHSNSKHAFTVLFKSLTLATFGIMVVLGLGGCGSGKSLQAKVATSPDSALVPAPVATGLPSLPTLTPIPDPELASVSITANNTTGIYLHTTNTNVTLEWVAKGVQSCSISPIGQAGLTGTYLLPNPQETVTYKLTCEVDESTTKSAQVVVVVPKVSITANGVVGRYTKAASADVTLSWNASGVQACSVNPIGQSGLFGSYVIPNQGPSASTTYTVTCSISATESVSDSVVVDVSQTPTPQVSIKANNSYGTLVLSKPGDVNISWSASGVTDCLITPFNRTDLVGIQTILNPGPLVTTTYEISCGVSGGFSINAQVKVIIPTLTMTANGVANKLTRTTASSVGLAWNGNGVEGCILSPNNLSVDSSGSITIAPADLTSDTIYFVTCSVGSSGQKLAAAVTVIIPTLPLFSETFETDVANLAVFKTTYPIFGITADTLDVTSGVLRTKGSTYLSIAGYSGDVVITSDMTGVSYDGTLNVGIQIGNRGYIFHPGWSGAQDGAFRVTNSSGTTIVGNINMGFVPSTSSLNHVQVRQRPNGIFNVTITDGASSSKVFNYNDSSPSAVGGAIRLTRSPGSGSTANTYSLFDNFKVKYAATLSSTPARSAIIDFGNMSSNSSKTIARGISLQNTGLIDSQIVISSYRISGPDAARFSVPDFVASTLTKGGVESVPFDVAFSSLGAQSYSALLTFTTNIGEISFPLNAKVLPGN